MVGKASERVQHLDWARVLVILAVFFFHGGRFFDPWGWHVKAPETFGFMGQITSFMVIWMMPLIFFLSGASTAFALEKGPARFLRDRFLRLLVPLAVGIFSHVMVQVYLENLTQKGFRGSLIEFIPHYFDGLYGLGGNFAWMGLHLWYLLVLFVFSLVLLPVFLWLRTSTGDRFTRALGRVSRFPGVLLLGAIPVIVLLQGVDTSLAINAKNWGGWSLWPYLVFLFLGYLLYRTTDFAQVVAGHAWGYLVAALVLTGALASLGGNFGTALGGWLGASCYGAASWTWILALVGLAARYLERPSRFVVYANEAVMPFYVLHQSVLIILGYFVLQLGLPFPVNDLLIMGLGLGTILVTYEWGIRRWNPVRVLFGMKPGKKTDR